MRPEDCKTCKGAVNTDRSNAVPMIGLRFGKLVVVKLVCYAPRHWKCRCECGNTSIVEGGNLRRKVNGTRFCGRCASAGVPRYAELKKKKEARNA